MGFPRQEYWSGLPFPSPGDLHDPGIEPEAPVLAYGFFTAEPPGKPLILLEFFKFHSPLLSRAVQFHPIHRRLGHSAVVVVGAAETDRSPTNTIIWILSTHSPYFLVSCSPPRLLPGFCSCSRSYNCCSSYIPWPVPCRCTLSLTSHGSTSFSSHHCLPPAADGQAGGVWRVRPLPPPQAGHMMRVRIWKHQPLLTQVEGV